MPQLNWLGDHEAKRTARKVPYRLLKPIEDATTAGKPVGVQLREALRT